MLKDDGLDSSSRQYGPWVGSLKCKEKISEREGGHTEKSNKMQQYQNLLLHIYMKLNMFRATHRPSSGA